MDVLPAPSTTPIVARSDVHASPLITQISNKYNMAQGQVRSPPTESMVPSPHNIKGALLTGRTMLTRKEKSEYHSIKPTTGPLAALPTGPSRSPMAGNSRSLQTDISQSGKPKYVNPQPNGITCQQRNTERGFIITDPNFQPPVLPNTKVDKANLQLQPDFQVINSYVPVTEPPPPKSTRHKEISRLPATSAETYAIQPIVGSADSSFLPNRQSACDMNKSPHSPKQGCLTHGALHAKHPVRKKGSLHKKVTMPKSSGIIITDGTHSKAHPQRFVAQPYDEPHDGISQTPTTDESTYRVRAYVNSWCIFTACNAVIT